MKQNIYICPDCNNNLIVDINGLRCECGKIYPFLRDTGAPVFACEADDVNEYTSDEAGEIHDNSLKWLFATFGGSEDDLRNNLVARLRLKKGQSVLVTGAGAGNDLPYIAQQIGKEGKIYAQDYSAQMLSSAIDRAKSLYGLGDYDIEFSLGDATRLPFPDRYFDCAYHFGGINLFSNIANGIREMDRVVKDGGRVVMGDEGLAPWLRNAEYGKIVTRNNPLCEFSPPLEELPETAREVNLAWIVGNCFYVIDYTVSSNNLPVDLDVPHVGKRGGSLRTRYYGVLEGVDPELKERIYAEADSRGISRVSLLEKFLREGLED